MLLCGRAYPGIVARLEVFFDIEVESDPLDPAMLKSRLRDKVALITGSSDGVDADLLAGLPYLKAVCKMDATHDDIDLEACTRSGVMATNMPDLGVGDEACRQASMHCESQWNGFFSPQSINVEGE